MTVALERMRRNSNPKTDVEVGGDSTHRTAEAIKSEPQITTENEREKRLRQGFESIPADDAAVDTQLRGGALYGTSERDDWLLAKNDHDDSPMISSPKMI